MLVAIHRRRIACHQRSSSIIVGSAGPHREGLTYVSLTEDQGSDAALLIVAIGAPAWIGAPSAIGSSTIVPDL